MRIAYFNVMGNMARGALAGAGLAFVAVQAVSCVGLLDLESYSAAVSALCASVSECRGASFYPDCQQRAGARLNAASADERGAFLTMFADNNCLENCTTAQACLDAIPICGAVGSSCDMEVHCCGFFNAGTSCRAAACCQPRGGNCTTDADCCDASCQGDSCGGVTCAQRGEQCSNDSECCGDVGVGATADDLTQLRCHPTRQECENCGPNDASCEYAFDCCSNYCDGSAGADQPGSCADPSCGFADGVKCTSATECCSDHCVPIPGSSISVCNSSNCIPDGFGCEKTSDCCSSHCDSDFMECTEPPNCVEPQQQCANPVDCCKGTCHLVDEVCCVPEGAACSATDECCSGAACDGLTCSRVTSCEPEWGLCSDGPDCCAQKCSKDGDCCKPVQNACSHGVCKQGDPLDRSCSSIAIPENGDANPYGDLGCIAAICDAFDACCCHEWTEECVTAVNSHCDATLCISET